MTAIEDARVVLTEHPRNDIFLRAALRDLIAEHERLTAENDRLRVMWDKSGKNDLLAEIERLTTPPTDDERALISAIAGDRGLSSVQCDALADDLVAVGFRRQGPITDERHAGYRQLHELVKDAPEGVRRAVGNEQQRVLANGSFALHPSMLLRLLTRVYEQGRRQGQITDEWEYARMNCLGHVTEPDDGFEDAKTRAAGYPAGYKGGYQTVVRRRKAGPWEPVETDAG
jgi:hypothetical protein